AQHGFVGGQGWKEPDGEERWRKFWKKLGNLSENDPPEKRLKSIALWEKWLAETPAPIEVLREAAEIAFNQDRSKVYWEQAIAQVSAVQIRARDYSGALKTIGAIHNPDARIEKYMRLAQAMARDGKREQAFEVLRPLKKERSWRDSLLDH